MPRGVYERSEEYRQKISAWMKGRPGLWTGKRRSDATRAKISAALQNRPLSDEHKKSISEANKGKPCKEETRKAISEAKKGKPFSPEHLAALIAFNKSRIGTHLSDDHKAAIGLRSKAYMASLSEEERRDRIARFQEGHKKWGASMTPEEWAIRLMPQHIAAQKAMAPKLEVVIGAALTELGIEHVWQYPVSRWLVDFWIPSMRIAIECNDAGHKQARAKHRDAMLVDWCAEHCINLLMLLEEDILADPQQSLIDGLRSFGIEPRGAAMTA